MGRVETPGRRRLPMPALEEWPRVGKLRIGEKVAATSRTGESIQRPSAIDYFRVDPEDGITSPEAAASFREVYGEKPTSLTCRLPGPTADACFEGAWRLYGTRKLKRVCDGETCEERTGTGGWDEKPCVCGARRHVKPTPKGGVCQLSWSLSFLLPDVVGMGVWQIDTGSEISVKRVSRWLQMMEKVSGDLMFLEFTLALVSVDVTPDGKTKAVHVLDPRTVNATPAALLSGGGRVLPALEAGAIPGPAVPPPADDDGAPEDDGDHAVEGEVIVPEWENVLADLRRMAPDLNDEEIGRELATCFGRKVTASELGRFGISGRAINYFLDRQEAAERSAKAAAGDDNDMGAAPPIPGQETLA